MILMDRMRRRSGSIYVRPGANIPVRPASYTVVKPPGMATATRTFQSYTRPARPLIYHTGTSPARTFIPTGASVRPSSGMPTRATAGMAPARTFIPSAGTSTAGLTGGLGLDFSGITDQLQGTGKEIVDRIQSFLPIAFKLLLVFIGVKVLFWVLKGRR
jgi:hypothetical protein